MKIKSHFYINVSLALKHRLKGTRKCSIRLYHTAATLSPETKKALFQHPKPRCHENESEAWGAETKVF